MWKAFLNFILRISLPPQKALDLPAPRFVMCFGWIESMVEIQRKSFDSDALPTASHPHGFCWFPVWRMNTNVYFPRTQCVFQYLLLCSQNVKCQGMTRWWPCLIPVLMVGGWRPVLWRLRCCFSTCLFFIPLTFSSLCSYHWGSPPSSLLILPSENNPWV